MSSDKDRPGSQETVARAITRDDVVAAIEMILGRAPPPELVDYHMTLGFGDRRALGDYMIGTEEFQTRYAVKFGRVGNLRSSAPVFLGDRVLAQTHRGHPIYLAPSDIDLSPPILLRGMWEQHVENVLTRCLRPGDTVIDLGANVGYHTLAMASVVGSKGQVHAFEANPEVMRLLRSTMFINGYRWVQLYECAILDQPGTVTLAAAPEHYGSGNIVIDSSPGYDAVYSRRSEVACATLDDTLADRVGTVDLIHLDIEGSEPRALRGGTALIERSPQLKIVTEWAVGMMNAHGNNVNEHVNWLAGLGFKFWYIQNHGELTPVSRSAVLDLPHCDLFLSREDPA